MAYSMAVAPLSSAKKRKARVMPVFLYELTARFYLESVFRRLSNWLELSSKGVVSTAMDKQKRNIQVGRNAIAPGKRRSVLRVVNFEQTPLTVALQILAASGGKSWQFRRMTSTKNIRGVCPWTGCHTLWLS